MAPTSRRSRRAPALVAVTLLGLLLVPALAWGALPLPVVDPTTPAQRDTEPVVLTGKDFPDWSARSNATVKLPLTDLIGCNELQGSRDDCAHNHYEPPEVDTQGTLGEGVPTDRLLGYRWDEATHGWRQIPFQVDQMFTRYLDNSASGFAIYSGEDKHTTYAFDREGWRYTQSDPSNPCLARPVDGEATTPDPVKGLDDDDELAFMASDAGPQAPADAGLPAGIESAHPVSVLDPLTGKTSYAYVMKAAAGGPKPAYDASNGYVHYARDANADFFERSVSSYSDYGNAAKGIVCDADGHPELDSAGNPVVDKRRPRDYAWITTPRYRFRYDGRWLMTQVHISPDGGRTYGPDLVDRWKARAFQQDPGSETPCCGYEEEDTNWGGSSTLLGERSGPVRTIRETWGADSGTNVIRRETFYRDEVRQKSYLRVHVIPPLDGIYAQWDFNAGVMKRFFNSHNPDGVPVDGVNDENVFGGNLDDPCNENYDHNSTSQLDQGYRTLYRSIQLCNDQMPYHQSVDVSDPTFSDANAALGWSETAGAQGTIVDRIQIDQATDLSPGGAAQSLVAVPYYRDDSCFDDGTGGDPGPKLHLRSADEPQTFEGAPRRCWTPADGDPNGSARFYQGSIATHGLHILFIADSDNARQTVPLTEIVAEQRMVMLPGDPGNVGEQYGRGFEKPLVALVGLAQTSSPEGSDPSGGGSPGGQTPPAAAGGGASGPGGSTPGAGSAGAPAAAGRRAAPRHSLRLVAPRFLRRGAVLSVRCVAPGARRCAVTLAASGRTAGTGARAGSGLIRVRISAAGRRLLRRARRGTALRLVGTATFRDAPALRRRATIRLR